MSVKEAKKANFAEAFKELEDIVQWFEASEVDLEEGLKKFERGLELAKKCRSRLAEVENKVTQIKEKFSDFADGGAASDEDEDEDDGQPRLI
ncbi:MAG: exodeoxyribonuclease VII small subunit [Patescibacteria group bacterium]